MTETQPASGQQRRAFWLKHLHQWHWISSAICLIGMLLFAVTGFTLNHAAQIEARPAVETRHAAMPTRVLDQVRAEAPAGDAQAREKKAPVPPVLADWLAQALDIDASGREAEWSADEIYVALPRPGGDAWVSLELDSGEAQYEKTTRGAISYLNDLHKGRNTGTAWFWFIDVFAVACVVFTLTGFFLLQLHARHRPSTWPLVAAGAAIPLIILLFFLHV